MASVIPFRGVRFDPLRVGDTGRAISPPYDVVDPAARQSLLARSGYNIAHVILADPADAYVGAAAVLGRWRAQGALRLDDRPAIYVWEQRFVLDGEARCRTSMVGLVGLARERGDVMPHERTLEPPKADRLRLLRATRMTFGQVFALYRDPDRLTDAVCDRLKSTPPLVDVTDGDGMGHRLWAMVDAEDLGAVRAALAPLRLLIADGHHRYETALNFLAAHPEVPGARWRMMTIMNMEATGLLILPIHRLVRNVEGYDEAALLSNLAADFDVRAIGRDDAARREMLAAVRGERGRGKHAFGMFTGDGVYRVATLRDAHDAEALAGVPPALAALDVTVLHKLIFEKQLGIDATKLAAGRHVDYVKGTETDPVEAVNRVRNGDAQAAFFMDAASVDETEAAALAGECMPQKTTFFYPKVPSGLVMHDLNVEVQDEAHVRSGGSQT